MNLGPKYFLIIMMALCSELSFVCFSFSATFWKTAASPLYRDRHRRTWTHFASEIIDIRIQALPILVIRALLALYRLILYCNFSWAFGDTSTGSFERLVSANHESSLAHEFFFQTFLSHFTKKVISPNP